MKWLTTQQVSLRRNELVIRHSSNCRGRYRWRGGDGFLSSPYHYREDIAQQVKQDYQEKQEVKRLARKIQIEQMKSFLGDDDKE